MYKCGSLFSGIGGFELGLERSIPNLETVWQVEQDKFCQKVLRKHWPNASIYDDVRTVGKHNLESVDIICGGFPCQDISAAGKQGGIYAERSGLWWEMHRIISELRPRVAVLENVPNLIALGMPEVLGSLSEIGYDAEWTIVSARQFGAPHMRKRVFIVAYADTPRIETGSQIPVSVATRGDTEHEQLPRRESLPPIWNNKRASDWGGLGCESSVCRMDDGIPARVDKIRGLGNAIVPQCSEWVGRKIWESGLLE